MKKSGTKIAMTLACFFAAFFFLMACGSEVSGSEKGDESQGNTSRVPVCSPGKTEGCSCDSGLPGERTCIEEGYRFSVCYIVSGSVRTPCTTE